MHSTPGWAEWRGRRRDEIGVLNGETKGLLHGQPFDISKQEFLRRIKQAKKLAREKLAEIMKNNEIVDPRAEKALQTALEVMESPTNNKDKLAAARLVLEYTKAKPAQKMEHNISSHTQMLAELHDEDEPVLIEDKNDEDN